MIIAKVVCDSINTTGHRLITLELTYPELMHSEFMTYRMFSRNASSSRALSMGVIRNRVIFDPVFPIFYGVQQKGMSASEELSPDKIEQCKDVISTLLKQSLEAHEKLEALGLHKQSTNRYLQPFKHITVIATGMWQAWEHLLFERDHSAAQPEFQALAKQIRQVIASTTPRLVESGSWHLPYISDEDRQDVGPLIERGAFTNTGPDSVMLDCLIRKLLNQGVYASSFVLAAVSAARCARVSYLNHNGKRDLCVDLTLFRTLVDKPVDQPRHWSPTEHAARADYDNSQSGNFVGFTQFRKLLGG